MRTSVVAVLALGALVALPGTATAATKQLSGTVKNSEGTKVGSITVKVSVKNGKAKRITGIRVRSLQSSCLGEDGVAQGPKITATMKTNIKVKKNKLNGKTYYGFQKTNARGGGYGWYVAGNFPKGKAKKITDGRVQGGGFQPAPEGTRCSILGNYTAK